MCTAARAPWVPPAPDPTSEFETIRALEAIALPSFGEDDFTTMCANAAATAGPAWGAEANMDCCAVSQGTADNTDEILDVLISALPAAVGNDAVAAAPTGRGPSRKRGTASGPSMSIIPLAMLAPIKEERKDPKTTTKKKRIRAKRVVSAQRRELNRLSAKNSREKAKAELEQLERRNKVPLPHTRAHACT